MERSYDYIKSGVQKIERYIHGQGGGKAQKNRAVGLALFKNSGFCSDVVIHFGER